MKSRVIYLTIFNFLVSAEVYRPTASAFQSLRELNQRLVSEIIDLRNECKKLRDFAGIWDDKHPSAPHSTPFTLKEYFLEWPVI